MEDRQMGVGWGCPSPRKLTGSSFALQPGGSRPSWEHTAGFDDQGLDGIGKGCKQQYGPKSEGGRTFGEAHVRTVGPPSADLDVHHQTETRGR